MKKKPLNLTDDAPLTDIRVLVNTSLVDVITKKIRSNIYTGKYESGKKLVVRELAEEFGVSHTPIKDALNRLVAEGYVEAPPRRSMVVRSYSNLSVLESMQVRLMYELFFADDIIRSASQHPELYTEMNAIMSKMRGLFEESENMSYEEWVQCETEFHSCYMARCGNNEAYKLYRSMDTNRVCYFTYLDTNHFPLRLSAIEMNLVEHQEIMDAIGALDANRFKKAIFQHITRVAEDYAVDKACLEKLDLIRASGKNLNA